MQAKGNYGTVGTIGSCCGWLWMVWGLLLGSCGLGAGQPELVQGGWFEDEPYQKTNTDHGLRYPGGLDVAIVRELFASVGSEAVFQPVEQSTVVEAVRRGELDFGMGLRVGPEEELPGLVALPYRHERRAVYFFRNRLDLSSLREAEALRGYLLEGSEMLGWNGGRSAVNPWKRLLGKLPRGGEWERFPNARAMVEAMVAGRLDLMIGDPVVMDRLLVEAGASGRIHELLVLPWREPVSLVLAAQQWGAGPVGAVEASIAEMERSGRLDRLHRQHILPAYLSITTGQDWFRILNLLGIVAFCSSGVLLARKERYNLSGALVLATLPAIGGGVLRDLFLGADEVFVLESPVYLLVAIGVVVAAFLLFKAGDWLRGRGRLAGRWQGLWNEDQFSWLLDRLFRFFDAWAVASFTVIGVSVALEAGATPLWLWGPAMAVVTSSGGVVLRDMVRADFNIEMLKQDTFAEVSLLGGMGYTAFLILVPYGTGLALILVATLTLIALLFGLRFWILRRGWLNPLQFGAVHTRPEARLDRFAEREPELWHSLNGYFTEDNQSLTCPVEREDQEDIHNRFLYELDSLREELNAVVAEPLSEGLVERYREYAARLEIASSVESNLFDYCGAALAAPLDEPEAVGELRQLLLESLRALVDFTATAVVSGERMDFEMLESMTGHQQIRFRDLRSEYAARCREEARDEMSVALPFTHKVERIIYLLGDYVRLRLERKARGLGNASNRKRQQEHLGH